MSVLNNKVLGSRLNFNIFFGNSWKRINFFINMYLITFGDLRLWDTPHILTGSMISKQMEENKLKVYKRIFVGRIQNFFSECHSYFLGFKHKIKYDNRWLRSVKGCWVRFSNQLLPSLLPVIASPVISRRQTIYACLHLVAVTFVFACFQENVI